MKYHNQVPSSHLLNCNLAQEELQKGGDSYQYYCDKHATITDRGWRNDYNSELYAEKKTKQREANFLCKSG